MAETIIFSTDKITLYSIQDIFNSVTNPTGTIIPRPGSLVLDVVNNGLLLRVVSVDPHTFNVTYGPVYTSLLAPPVPAVDEPGDANIVSIIDYGNSRFYLFYDKAENPTKLNVDKKVIILGDDAVSFEISKYNDTTKDYLPISLYYDTDGTYRGTRIPLTVIGSASNAKVPSNCHTSMPINDGELYHMFIYDYAGTQCGSITLFAKKALINNALDDTLLIEDFTLEATQMDSDGFYLFPDQDPASLVITPRLIFNDGTARAVAIDNSICHLYGLEGFTAAYPGQSVDLLVKYFLAPGQQAVGDALNVAGSSRFMMRQTSLTVRDPGTNEYSIKIMTVPVYLPSLSKWTMMFFLYTIGDDVVRNITANVRVAPNFDGRYMGIDQSLMLSLRIRDIFPDAASDFVYQQPLVIKVAPYDYDERYILRDSIGDTYGVYGVDSPILSRPVLYFDGVLEKYFIPTSKFGTQVKLLEAFYYKSRPLYDSGKMPSPVPPTHFTIRNAVNGMLLLPAPIAIDGYQQAFSLVNVDQPNQLLGTNCIVEFLRYEQQKYMVLYGCPVDVKSGTFS